MLGTLALSLFLSWVQVSSETYIVKSSVGEERAKRVLTELERFHQLVGTLVFRNTELPNLRTAISCDWGAHAPRVLVIAPSRSRTFSVPYAEDRQACFDEAPKPTREGACAPRNFGHACL